MDWGAFFVVICLTFNHPSRVMRQRTQKDLHMARKTTPKTASKEESPADAGAQPVLKKPELFDAVVTRTNLKKRDVKPAVETAMAVIAEALREGTDVNLPPLGKLRIVKSKTLENGATVLTLKLRTPPNATVAAAATDESDV